MLENEEDDGKVDDGGGGGDKDDGGAKEADDLITIINADDFKEESDDDKAKAGKKDAPAEKEDGGKEKIGDKEKKPDQKKPDDDPEKVDLVRKNKDLNRALHELRQEVKTLKTGKGDKDEDGKDVLSDAQIEALMVEYKDDPKTMLNIIKYQAERAAKGAAKKTVDDADTVKRKKETEDYVYKNYPDLTKDDSELRASVNKTKEALGLSDHPYGELLGTSVTALMSLPTLLKTAYDKGRSDVEAGVKEKTRKDLIKDGDLTPKGKGGGKTDGKETTKDVSDVARRLNLNTPRQQALLKKLTAASGRARTVMVED